ncbi:hypothetical protein KIN20_033739 [Parelaphostrongylus tenuis]|uniref:Uncharacterized protein n=1 Tax=Parelaphostrongylus tenuis TaxID=148309 RepID=A0AAD5R968_PARTN|nr:hypothetical protein KIN20_033739 [Parelaphostrongylus tenuis]
MEEINTHDGHSGSNLRVLAALICPPAALALAYKTSRVSSEIRTDVDDEVEVCFSKCR